MNCAAHHYAMAPGHKSPLTHLTNDENECAANEPRHLSCFFYSLPLWRWLSAAEASAAIALAC